LTSAALGQVAAADAWRFACAIGLRGLKTPPRIPADPADPECCARIPDDAVDFLTQVMGLCKLDAPRPDDPPASTKVGPTVNQRMLDRMSSDPESLMVMPAAEKKTQGDEPDDDGKLPAPDAYPVRIAAMDTEVVGQLAAGLAGLLQPAPLLPEDCCILTILANHGGKALTYRQILNESVKMNRADPRAARRLTDSAIRQRVPVLLVLELVARPKGTKKKGVGITEAGRRSMDFARGNPTETQRKN
jgi:hypothetical protein